MAHKNQERSSYEQQWKQAFEQAELKPSDDLWENIDGALTRQESGKYRRGFFFYRAVAAVALLVLAGLGLYTANDYLLHRQDNTVSSATDQPAAESTLPAQPLSPEAPVASRGGTQSAQETDPAGQVAAPDHAAATPLAGQGSLSDGAVALANPKAKARATVAAPVGLPDNTQQAREDGASVRQAVAVSYIASRGIEAIPPPGMAWVQEVDQLYLVPNPYVKDPRKEADRTVFFAGLTLAGNYFDPNISAQPSVSVLENALTAGDYNYNAPLSMADAKTSNSWATTQSAGVRNTPDISLSYAAQVGMHLTKHLSLESGIGYGRFNTQTSTNWSIQNAQSDQKSPLAFSNTQEASRNLRYSPTTNFTNSFELLSLPLKMGYHIIWGSVDVFLSSGMAANFFIRNTLSDAGGQYEEVSIGAGENSPYKPVFYTGLVSGGVNYNFSGNYFLTLAPKYQFALTEMTQNDALITSQPYSFGMDLGLRYTFR